MNYFKLKNLIPALQQKSSLLIFIIVLISCSKNNKLELNSNGVSNYEIVLLDSKTKHGYESAEILQTYLQKISGIKLNIVDENHQKANKHKIYIENDLDNILSEHQIKITSKNNNLIISGGSEEALRNAVYEFLEVYLGCKWYAPNVEYVPNSKSITIASNINYSYTPEITTRTVHSRLFYEDETFAGKHKVTTKAFPYYVPSARVHTFNKFIPEEKFYKSHPEYFALRGDQRLPTQLCLTNNEVAKIVKDSVQALFNRHPEALVISVSSNDNTQYCECDNCKKIDKQEESHAGTMIRFVNKIADSFPDKTISTLAYQYTRKPCKTKPKENVLITLCSIECDRSAPIEEKCLEFAEDLKGWKELTENIRIWDYTTQFTNFLAPFPNLHTLQPNIQFFRNNNAQWVFEQHSNNPSELFELRSYVMAKLLWKPDSNIEDLITEFTNGYYKEGGIYIKKYVDLIHSKIKEDDDFFLFLYGDPSQAFKSYLSPELLTSYSAFFNEAEKAVAGNSAVINRIKISRLGIDFAVLEACRKNISKTYNLKSEIVKPLLENFKNVSDDTNITLMNEMGFTVDEYYKAFLKATKVALQPNKAFEKKVFLLTKPKKYADENPRTLTDGALGGSSFYSNWLGFEGNNMEVIIDLETPQKISTISTAFLQVTNHVVFFPTLVTYFGSTDGIIFKELGRIENRRPLNKKSKINDIQYFDIQISGTEVRYVKVKASNLNKAPFWHHAARLPAWVFADEVIIN
jgi:hypothetical protein